MNIIRLYKNAFEGLNAKVWLMAFMMFVNRLGTLILPFLTLYATQELEWTATKGGAVASSFAFGGLFGAYLGGIFTDKIGYYKTMIISLAGAAVLFFLAQYVTDFYGLCSILFFGALMADLLRPALFSGLSYITDQTTQTRAISLMRMSFNLGIAVGPAVAGIIIATHGYGLIFTVDGLTCFLALIVLITLLGNYETESKKEEVAQDTSGQTPYKDVPFIFFLISNLLVLTAFFQILGTIPLWIKEGMGLTEKEVGLFFTANGLIIFIFEMILIRYIEDQNISKFKALIYGGLMMGIALLSLVLPKVYFLPLIVYTLLVSFGEIINFPFISTTALDRSTPASRGSYMGLTSMTFSLALIIAPLLGTFILDNWGYDVLWTAMCIITGVGLVGYMRTQKYFE